MSFMQPRVFIANVFEVETDCGTEVVLEDVVGKDPSPEDFENYLEGEYESHERFENAVLAHLTAPGYLDQTDLCRFETETEAWEYLVEQHPDAFTWQVETTAENPTAHIHAPTEEAALALRAAVQSVNGSNLEQDGTFLYAAVSDAEAASQELLDAGFRTEESA
jgi:hypothetical protein